MNHHMGIKTTLNVNSILSGILILLISAAGFFIKDWMGDVKTVAAANGIRISNTEARIAALEIENRIRWDATNRKLQDIESLQKDTLKAIK